MSGRLINPNVIVIVGSDGSFKGDITNIYFDEIESIEFRKVLFARHDRAHFCYGELPFDVRDVLNYALRRPETE